jgi:hypothetical protein
VSVLVLARGFFRRKICGNKSNCPVLFHSVSPRFIFAMIIMWFVGLDRPSKFSWIPLRDAIPVTLWYVYSIPEGGSQYSLQWLETVRTVLLILLVYSPQIHSSTKGGHLECKYSLQTFGIPVSLIPIVPNGEPTNEHHVERMEKRRRHEREAHPVERVGVPGSFDVLVGRGKTFQEHRGNKQFRNLIDAYCVKYCDGSKSDKTALTEKIVDLFKQTSGRFLKHDGAGWVEVSDDVARLKVSHCFRDQKRKLAQRRSQFPDSRKFDVPPCS